MRVKTEGGTELRKITCFGPQYTIYENELFDERPFAVFCPDPEPHTMVGLSMADYVMDLQKIKSSIIRGMLDSLSLTVNPQQEVVKGEVEIKDLLQPEVGGVVRVNKPGMIREIVHSFVGKEAFPVLQYMDEQKENRTGISKAAAGLDADALQSSTKAAVAATMSGAQQHIEMVARIFAETGMTELYNGLLKLTSKHQDEERTVRLRNEWVEVDPRAWDTDMDVTVNVALGAGLTEEKLQTLAMISTKQEQLMATGSPLVSAVEYRATLGRFVELAGWANSAEFFKPWSPEEEQKAQEAKANQPPPPDPTMLIAQAEMQKAQLEVQKHQDTMAFKAQELKLKDDRERDKAAQDYALREMEIQAQYQVKVEDAAVRDATLRRRNEMDADLKAAQAMAAPSAGQGA